MSDIFTPSNEPLNDPGGNWCPDCGLPRGVCECETMTTIRFEPFWPDTPDFYGWEWEDWLEDYDYTEGDVGQDGEI